MPRAGWRRGAGGLAEGWSGGKSEAQGPPPRGPPQKSKDLLGAATQATLGLNTTGFEYEVGSPEVYTYIWPWVPFKGNPGLDSLQKEPRARCRCILLGCHSR